MTSHSCRLWLFPSLLASRPLYAAIESGVGIGQALSGQLSAGRRFPIEQKIYTLSAAYQGDLHYQLLPSGRNIYLAGLALHTGSVSYRAGEARNQGVHLALGLRGGIGLWVRDNILLTFQPEYLIYTRMSAASYSESLVDGKRLQSSSLSEYSGHGGLGFQISGSYKFSYKWKGMQPLVGLTLLKMQQSYSQKNDSVISTNPSTGASDSLSKSSGGSFALSSFALQLQLGTLL